MLIIIIINNRNNNKLAILIIILKINSQINIKLHNKIITISNIMITIIINKVLLILTTLRINIIIIKTHNRYHMINIKINKIMISNLINLCILIKKIKNNKIKVSLLKGYSVLYLKV